MVDMSRECSVCSYKPTQGVSKRAETRAKSEAAYKQALPGSTAFHARLGTQILQTVEQSFYNIVTIILCTSPC